MKTSKKESSSGNGLVLRLPLSRERILEAAMELADAGGVDSVSMRRVAQGLGVEAMSLYKHVANKEDLLDGLVELVVAEMGVSTPGTEWKAALRERAYAVRKTLNRHPWASNLIESRRTIGPSRLRHNECMIRILRDAGFSIELAFHSMIALTSYVYGFVILEEGSKRKGEAKEVANLSQAISPTDYPYVFEMISFVYREKQATSEPALSRSSNTFADFEFGLRQLMEGFESVLKGN